MAVQTKQQAMPQAQAPGEGAVLVEMTNNTARSPQTVINTPAANRSAPLSTSPLALDQRPRKRAASHEAVSSDERDSQHKDKRSRNYLAATSDATEGQPKTSADTASFKSVNATANRTGGPATQSEPLTLYSGGRSQGDLHASSAGNPTRGQDLFTRPQIPAPSKHPIARPHDTGIRLASTSSSSYTHTIPRMSIDHWSPPRTSRPYVSPRMSHKCYNDSFDQRPRSVDPRAQRSQAGGYRPYGAYRSFSRPLSWRQEQRYDNIRPDPEHRLGRGPHVHGRVNLIPGSVPPTHTRRCDAGLSLTSTTCATIPTGGMTAAGSEIMPRESLNHPDISSSNQALEINDVEALERLHSEISEHGRILEKALWAEDPISMSETEVAGSQDKRAHKVPNQKQPKQPRVNVQAHLTTRAASREMSELPDIEQILTEARESQQHPESQLVPSTVVKPAEDRGSHVINTVKESHTVRLDVEAQDVSAVIQPDVAKPLSSTSAKAPAVSVFSRAAEKESLPIASGPTLIANAACHVRGPKDQVVTGGSTSSSVPPKQVPSYPNTIQVQPPSNTKGQRRFMRPVPSKAREIEMGSCDPLPGRCTCSYLPEYFRNPSFLEPSIETWPAGKTEFLAHCQQIIDCPAHPDITRRTCRMIVDEEDKLRADEVHKPARMEIPTLNSMQDKCKESSSRPLCQQQNHIVANPLKPPILHIGSVSNEKRKGSQKADDPPSTRAILPECNVRSLQEPHRERPQFRVPPGFPHTPTTEPTKDPVITTSGLQVEGSRSKSPKQSTEDPSHSARFSLPTPAKSSSPTRAEADDSLQPIDDDEDYHSSLQSSPTPNHASVQPPGLVDQSGQPTPALRNSNNGSFQNSKTIGKAVRGPSGPDGSMNRELTSITVSDAQRRNHDMQQCNKSTITETHTPTPRSLQRVTESIHRRHATEPPHSPKLMSPVKALVKASQPPTRKPLFPIPIPNSNFLQPPTPSPQAHTAAAAAAAATTITTITTKNPKPPTRPLWQQTPPPTPPHRRNKQKRYVPADERKQQRPELSRYVPPKDREPDEKLIEYGKMKLSYDRHLAAPYAFRYCGKLWREYVYLAGLRDARGVLLWEEGLGRRLGKKG
ncbi:MAG: hypothetical protein Q9169_001944 [Polycauliona sp. 2 TL-2023]